MAEKAEFFIALNILEVKVNQSVYSKITDEKRNNGRY